MTATTLLGPLALTVGLLGGACSGNWPAVPGDDVAPDAPAVVDVGPDAVVALTPVRFDGDYDAHSVLHNRCDHRMHFVGSEPAEPGRYPVAIFFVGTNGTYDARGIVERVLPALARQGFVAATVAYENNTLFGAAQNCSLYRDNAACVVRNDADYVNGQRHSALAQLCGRPNADCSKGVVFLGHSQGGLTAVQAFRTTPLAPPGEAVPQLVAVAPMGVGAEGYLLGIRVIDLRSCMAAETLPVDPTAVRIVNGENDRYFNGPDADQAGGQTALELVTGRACSVPSWDCRGTRGDGYLLVKPSELSHGRAAHDFMHDFAQTPIAEFAEPNWSAPDNAAPWSLYATVRWLRSQTQP